MMNRFWRINFANRRQNIIIHITERQTWKAEEIQIWKTFAVMAQICSHPCCWIVLPYTGSGLGHGTCLGRWNYRKCDLSTSHYSKTPVPAGQRMREWDSPSWQPTQYRIHQKILDHPPNHLATIQKKAHQKSAKQTPRKCDQPIHRIIN